MAKTLAEHNHHGIDATIIADSKNPQGDCITTLVVTIPRIVLAEFNTHRMFSRNSASSRAIPFGKMANNVTQRPFIPVAFQKSHKGMQGTEYFEGNRHRVIQRLWLTAAGVTIKAASVLHRLGVTKQLCNRLLEPFMWHTIIVTATEWENFFKLRCPQYKAVNDEVYRSRKDFKHIMGLDDEFNPSNFEWLQMNEGGAEIHISRAAELMWDAMNESTPRELKAGEWHIPFGDNILIPGTEGLEANTMKAVKIATARCARVSYMNFDGTDNYEKDIELHDMLSENGHASPFEHCARAMSAEEYRLHLRGVADAHIEPQYPDILDTEGIEGWCRNFRGFIQYRELIES